MSIVINRPYTATVASFVSLVIWTLIGACSLEPNAAPAPSGALRFSISVSSLSIDGAGDTDMELRLWVLPEEEMQAAVNSADPGMMPVLTEDQYASLLAGGVAVYEVAHVSAGGGSLAVEVQPGRYHVQVELVTSHEAGNSILVDATYLDWTDPEGSLSGELRPGMSLGAGSVTEVSFVLRNGDHLYPLMMTAGPARVSARTNLASPSTILVEPLSDEYNGLQVIAYPNEGIAEEGVTIVEHLDQRVPIYLTQSVDLEFFHADTAETTTVRYDVAPPAPRLGQDFLNANAGNEQVDVSTIVSLAAHQAPDDGPASTYPAWWNVGETATFTLESRMHDSDDNWVAEVQFNNVSFDEEGEFFEPYTLFGSEQSALSLADKLARDVRVRYSSPHFADTTSVSEELVAYPLGPIPSTPDFNFDLDGQFDTGDILEVLTGEDLRVIVQFPDNPAAAYMQPDDVIILSVGGFAEPVEEIVISAQELAGAGEMLVTLMPWEDLESFIEEEEQPVIGVSAEYHFLTDPNGFAIWRDIVLVEMAL